MLIVGLDFSTHAIDMVALELDTDQATWHRRRLDDHPGLDAYERCRRVRDAMPARGHWKDAGVVAVAMEEPFSRSLREARAYGRLEGALLATLPPGLRVIRFHPTTWKKQTVGKGNATKADVAAWVKQTWPIDTHALNALPQDALDSYAIAYAGRLEILPLLDSTAPLNPIAA